MMLTSGGRAGDADAAGKWGISAISPSCRSMGAAEAILRVSRVRQQRQKRIEVITRHSLQERGITFGSCEGRQRH